jgi:pSer/pThr/pTyr-binding forkhead associated (FHA) protein/serine/threonine protein kinase
MIKLVIETPEGISEFNFKNEAVLGRDTTCEVQILDPLSSRRHCRIYREEEKFFVEDLNSSNGTKLNGEAVKKSEITEKDCVQIGQVKIKIQKKHSVKIPKTIFEPVVIQVKNSEKSKEYHFAQNEIVFGREDSNDVALNEKLSSRKQFKFIVATEQIFIEDLGSANGTKIKDEKITGKILYRPGTIVTVGGTEITLNLKNVVQLPILVVSRLNDVKELILNGEIIFGRDATCQFVLQEGNSSRRHFKIYKEGETLYVEDLKSSNGTRHNGIKLTNRAELKPGDLVSVGETNVSLKRSANDPDMAILEQNSWKLSVVADMEAHDYVFVSGMEVGRGDDCAVIIKDVKSSRKHCKILLEDGKYYVEDLGSSNGTKVDGVAITKKEITENNLIEIGTTKIRLARGTPDKMLGQAIRGYQVLKCVGNGDNGAEYIGRQTSMKRLVTLKVVAEKFLETEAKKQNFLKDTVELAKIQHPHLLTILESFSHRLGDKEVHILATEYLEGLPLSKRIQKKGKIEVNNAVHFAEQACAALQVLHSKNLFHKNIKPSIFLITKEGKVKLADAGLSKPELKSEYELSTEAIWYEAPERAKGKPATAASDIYELGATLYHAVTGRVPFEGKTALAVNTKKINMLPEEPIKIDLSISANLNKVIVKCMQIDPSLRYASVGELQKELEALNVAPVVWDAGEDYRQFEKIKKQDYQSVLWIIVGVLSIIGITLNWWAINYNTETNQLARGYFNLEAVASAGKQKYDENIQTLKEIIQGEYPKILKDKAKEFKDKLEFMQKDVTPKDQIDLYIKAIELISQGGDNVQEGYKIIKNLSQIVSPDTTFGKKVIKKEQAIKALLIIPN